MRSTVLASLAVAMILTLPLATCAGVGNVTVTGWGAVEDSSVEDARARAIADALGRAVQRAGRTVVTAETRLINDWDISSRVAADTFGIVRGWKVLDEGLDATRGYRVKLVAQVTTADPPASAGTKVLVIAREQYAGKHRPPQLLGGEIARRLRGKGYVVKSAEWQTPLVSLAKGELRVNADRVKELRDQYGVDLVLIAWAESRPSESVNKNLHSARSSGQLRLYSAETGDAMNSHDATGELGWGPTQERAGDEALKVLRESLAERSVLLVVQASRRP